MIDSDQSGGRLWLNQWLVMVRVKIIIIVDDDLIADQCDLGGDD